MLRLALVAAAVLWALVAPLPSRAQVSQLAEPDGTVHVTNMPRDPVYQRLGIAPPAPPAPRAATTLTVQTAAEDPDLVTHIRAAADRHGLPEQLVHAVIRVESSYNPRAVSPKGARGLMQLMPGTAVLLGVRDAFDPLENLEGGVRHLRGLIDRLGDLALALAAYNAGEKAVTQYGGIPPYPETRQYVSRVLQLAGPAPAVAAEPEPARSELHRRLEPDGTTIYSNTPPRSRR